MIQYEVVITGTSPILFHNPSSMTLKKSAAKKSIPTPAVEADASAYWNRDKTTLVFPGPNLHRALVEASRGYKVGKRSIVPYVAGSVQIEEFEIPFNTTKYEIDTRRAVVQRQGIMRSRARLDKWTLAFTLNVDSEDMEATDFGALQEILKEAGRRIGVGDFRPSKGGPFGKFVVKKFKQI